MPVRPFLTDWADFGRPVSEFGFPPLGPLEFALTKPLPCQKKSEELAKNVSEPGSVLQVVHPTQLLSFLHRVMGTSGVCAGPPGGVWLWSPHPAEPLVCTGGATGSGYLWGRL